MKHEDVPMRNLSPFPQKMNSFLEKFSVEVEGFNQKSLGLNQLIEICDGKKIELIEKPFRGLHGIAIEDRQHDYIFINQIISYSYKVIAGYHELFHILHHVGNGQECLSYGGVINLSKKEYQAQAVGVIALMPDVMIQGLSIEDLMREFDVSRRIAEFRFCLTR